MQQHCTAISMQAKRRWAAAAWAGADMPFAPGASFAPPQTYGMGKIGEEAQEAEQPSTRSRRPGKIKGGTVGNPTIRRLGPYVRSHPRHFRQQSEYTICESLDAGFGWQYDSRQAVFDQGHPTQDLLWRFDIPVEERRNVLRELDSFNLNAYSLFDSEEPLLETMWLREQDLNTD